MKNGKNFVKRRDWKMAMGTQLTSTQQQQQYFKYSNATVSSIYLSNGTVSNGTGFTVSNSGNYLTTANAGWSVYTNYMKPKSFKLR